MAPKAKGPVPIPTRVVVELVHFGTAAGALAMLIPPMPPSSLRGREILPHRLLDEHRRSARQLRQHADDLIARIDHEFDRHSGHTPHNHDSDLVKTAGKELAKA